MNARACRTVLRAAQTWAAVVSISTVTAATLADAARAAEPGPPPLVEEAVDEIVVVQATDDRYGRVVFFRGGKILDDRVLIPDRMDFSAAGDGFTVEWDDYATGPAFRRVTARSISYAVPSPRSAISNAEALADPRNAWWGQDVNMCRLKRP